MSTADVEQAPAPAVPDYLADPNAVLKDTATWRYGKAPDYSNTRTVYEQTKKNKHEAGSLPSLVENLVKNWEVEASFKKELSDWRTVDHTNYTFAINGGPPQSAEHMLKVGTYNAIIASNEFYSPANSDFTSSHKTFKRMMPTFAWEVVEVYSGPPQVAFRWRHWGQMKNDYIGFNDKGEKITAKAHGGTIDIEGVTVAQVDDQVRLQKVETWFDPLEMFRQIAPNGIVNKEIQPTAKIDETENDCHEEITGETDEFKKAYQEVTSSEADRNAKLIGEIDVAKVGSQTEATENSNEAKERAREEVKEKLHGAEEVFQDSVQGNEGEVVEAAKNLPEGAINTYSHTKRELEEESKYTEDNVIESSKSRDQTKHSLINAGLSSDFSKGKLEATPSPGDALAAAPTSEETKLVHEEMSKISAAECPFLMNKE